MTKEELKQEAEEYTETKGKEHFRKFYNSDKNIAELITQVYIDCAEPREKRITELRKEITDLQNDREIFLSDFYCDRKGGCKIAELEQENAELKSIADLQQSGNMSRYFELKRQAEKLEEAKKLIKKMLDYGLCCVCKRMISKPSEIKAEAEQFLKDCEVEK